MNRERVASESPFTQPREVMTPPDFTVGSPVYRNHAQVNDKEPPKPFMEFKIKYDPWTHKALEHRLGKKDCCARPHMRAFHLAWSSFLIAFLAWFSFAPLAPIMKKTLNLTQNDILVANLTSVLTTVFARFCMGPIMDVIGPRVVQSSLLLFSAVPLLFARLLQGAAGLATIRGLVGLVGATFVGCQFWTSLMFEQELAGTMNATAAGWGNLGGGLAQVVMVGIYNMNLSFLGCDEECAWRNAFYIPSFLLVVASFCVMKFGDDGPKEAMFLPPYEQTQLRGYGMANVASNLQVWYLMIQYAVCFGVELHVNNTAALYFFDRFGLDLTTAGIVASSFGLMNLFARSWGGLASDYFYSRFGMNGRKYCHIFLTCCEGATLVVFSRQSEFGASIFFLIVFSIFVQGAEGSTFGIVPYVDLSNTGAVCGFVGAGGNIGAVIWGSIFLVVPSFAEGYLYLGLIAFIVGLTGILIDVSDEEVLALKKLEQERRKFVDPTLQLGGGGIGPFQVEVNNPGPDFKTVNLHPRGSMTTQGSDTPGTPGLGARSIGSRINTDGGFGGRPSGGSVGLAPINIKDTVTAEAGRPSTGSIGLVNPITTAAAIADANPTTA